MCSVVQVDLRVLRPGVLTITGTEGGGQIAVRLVVINGGIDVHEAVERTTTVVVTTKDTRTVATDQCVLAVPADMGLIDIARLLVGKSIAATEDAVEMNGGRRWHTNHGAARDTLVAAGSEDITHTSTEEVDNRCSLNIRCSGSGLVNAHTDTAEVAGTEHHGIGERRGIVCIIALIGNVDEHIAAVLHDVAVGVHAVALTSTIDAVDHVVAVVGGLEVDKGIGHARLGKILLGSTVLFGIGRIMTVTIVVVTIAATKDIVDTPLDILHIG